MSETQENKGLSVAHLSRSKSNRNGYSKANLQASQIKSNQNNSSLSSKEDVIETSKQSKDLNNSNLNRFLGKKFTNIRKIASKTFKYYVYRKPYGIRLLTNMKIDKLKKFLKICKYSIQLRKVVYK